MDGSVNHAYARKLITREVRDNRVSLAEAARMVIRNLGGIPNVQRVVRDVILEIHAEFAGNEGWGGTSAVEHVPWYTGVEDDDVHWPAYVEKMKAGSLAEAVGEIDAATHDIVSRIADPSVPGAKKKGLVVGYVQSGKTANYSGVISKAADAGYQLVIVLAGMHNNLRRQTQVRLKRDLLANAWYPLTSDEADFRNRGGGGALFKPGTKALAVVKKQQVRLAELRDFLQAIPKDIMRTVPVLLIDDEADQATPNTKAANEELSRINELVREVWAAIPTGTYIGYTATPFANVFMDPNDDSELYPSDFITSLPKPDGYFGAEELFGGNSVPFNDLTDGIDAIRYVPEVDSEALKPPTDKDERADFEHGIPSSLEDATVWFLTATATRRARGQEASHSSMLVHTTHYTDPHFAMKKALEDFLEKMKASGKSGDYTRFQSAYESEIRRCEEFSSFEMLGWDDIQPHLLSVLQDCQLIVDNSYSTDRLDYEKPGENASGASSSQTVIAIGGGTLSRGLTLEGLVVSYFLRTSSTYDTLLQMGRWFGYRKGYEDLPRIWMPADLKLDFEFLAGVEIELREEIRRLIAMEMSPRELGIRVRSHPGRLAITASNKLVHAERTNLSFTGTRLQTFIFDMDPGTISANRDATKKLLLGRNVSERTEDTPAYALFEDLPASDIATFFTEYEVHEKQTNMPGQFISEWISEKAGHTLWNVAVMGREKAVDALGSLTLAPNLDVPAVNRAPLASSVSGEANIKALLSLSDYVADLSRDQIGAQTSLDGAAYQQLRHEHGQGRGLLLIYAVSANSVPTTVPKQGKPPVRKPMEAPDHMVGIGVIFPGFDQVLDVTDGNFFSVTPKWEIPDGDQDGLSIESLDEEGDGEELPDEWAWLNENV